MADPSRRRHCPACWSLVSVTMHGCIEGHWDTVHRPCVAAGEPYGITLSLLPSRHRRSAA